MLQSDRLTNTFLRFLGHKKLGWVSKGYFLVLCTGTRLTARTGTGNRFLVRFFYKLKTGTRTISNKNYMTSLNRVFNISSNCLSGNNHTLSQYSPNPVNFLSIRGDYFYTSQIIRQSRHVSHSHFFCARETREMSPLSQLL